MQINRNLANLIAYQNGQTAGQSAGRPAQKSTGSSTGSIVDRAAEMIKTDHAAKADVKVVRLADEMLGRAIDIKG